MAKNSQVYPRSLWGALKSEEESVQFESSVSGMETTPGKTVSEAIDKIGYGPFQTRLGMLIGLAQFSSALQQVSTTFLVYHLGDLLSLEVSDQGLLPAVTGACMLFGGLILGYLSDTFGRRPVLLSALSFASISAILSSMFSSYTILLIMRGLISLALGGIHPIVYSIFVENLPTYRRGFYLNLIEFCWSLGAVCCCVIAWIVLPNYGWQWFMGILSIPMIVTTVLSFQIPETAHFLDVIGDFTGSNEAIGEMARVNGHSFVDVSEIFQRRSSYEDFLLLDNYHNGPYWEEHLGNVSFEVFENHPSTFYLLSLFFLLSCGVSIFVWIPDILRYKNIDPTDIYKSLVIMYSFQLPGELCIGYLLDIIGRPKTIYLSIMVGIFWTCLFGLSQSEAVITISIGFMQFCLAGSIGAANVFASEMYPTFLRATALGITHSAWTLGIALSPELWAYMLQTGVHFSISIGTLVLFIAALMPIFAHFDTVNKRLA